MNFLDTKINNHVLIIGMFGNEELLPLSGLLFQDWPQTEPAALLPA